MNKLPKEVNSLARRGSLFRYPEKSCRTINYIINDGEETETRVQVELPVYFRPEMSEVIADDSNDFVNGFKVVKMKNGEYAYVRESNNSLLPFRYDVAFNFNEYGFAMVGKDGGVSWIDKNFNYLNLQGEMQKENTYDPYSNFVGWQSISAFSDDEIPLSHLYYCAGIFKSIEGYFGADGKIRDIITRQGGFYGETEEIERLTVFEEALKGLYAGGYCKGIISKKKIRLMVGMLSEDRKRIEHDKGLVK